jgi:DNA-binding FrmR family transcriptional regulator
LHAACNWDPACLFDGNKDCPMNMEIRLSYVRDKEHFKMTEYLDTDNLHRRIGKIVGQIKAIDKMVDDEDVPCEDILIQISAVNGALHKVGQAVLEGHLNCCIREGIENGNADKTIADFAKAVEHFARIT